MKKLILSLALLSSAVVSADSYLYWMVDTSSDYAYARILTPTDNYLTIYDQGFDYAYNEAGGASGVSKSTVTDFANNDEGFFASLNGIDVASSTFIIELYNDSGKFISQSTLSGSAAAQYVYKGGTSAVPATAWSASSFAIPEPSSGLLMLVGCAVLGLRRRKQKNA